MKPIIVFYHANCADGFSAAWAARKKLGLLARYIAISHHDRPIRNLKGKRIYFLDIVYKEKAMREFVRGNEVIIIDHHASARDIVKLVKERAYTLKNSGAVLAWRYFFPKRKVPKLLQYVEDCDLWNWRLPHSKEIRAYLDLYDFSFSTWDRLAREMEQAGARKKMIEHGRMVLRSEERVVNEIAAGAELVEFAGRKVLAVAAPVFHSEVGHVLVERRPPFSITWHKKGDTWRISLRSKGEFDVGKIAERHGGGGHRNAAAFNIPLSRKLPWKTL